jgi:hypothetical protein
MNQSEAFKDLENWCAKLQQNRFNEELRNEMRRDVHKLVFTKISQGLTLTKLFDWIVEQEKLFAGLNMQGPYWAHQEYVSVRQKLWGLKQKVK